MLLSSSPRGSFSVPVHINLHGVRRRRTREILHYPSLAQESHWRKNRGGEKVRAQVPVSSVGEERALLLGFIMMAFSILMYFVMGIAVVKPCFLSDWGDPTNCSVVQVEFLNESDDCRSTTNHPCLQVFVNITASGSRMRLRYDEAAVNLSPECFYTPKNQQNKTEVLNEAQRIKEILSELRGKAMACHLSSERYPDDAVLKRRYTVQQALDSLVWPTLMLAGGALLVGMVMLTQCLAQLSSELAAEAGEVGETTAMQGGLYRLLRYRPGSPSTEYGPAAVTRMMDSSGRWN